MNGKLAKYKEEHEISDEINDIESQVEEENIEFEEEDDIEFEDNYDDLIEKAESKFNKKSDKDKTIEEVEFQIMGLILKNKKVPEDVNEHLFSSQTLKEVFKGITHFSNQNEDGVFDPKAVGILLSRRHNNTKWKDSIIPDLLVKADGEDKNITDYLTILNEEHICLKANKIAEAIREHVNKGELDYIKIASSELNSIELFTDSGYDSLEEAINTAIFNIDEKRESDGQFSGIPTGIQTLDETTGGLQRSDLIILAARPGQGKTATAINFAYNSGVPCGFISSEMPSEQLGLRLLSLDSGVNAQKIRNPKKLTESEVLKLKESGQNLKENHQIYIDDKPGISIQEVREQAKKWKEKYDIQVLFIDYIQRLTYKAPGSDKMARHEKIGMVAMEAKEIARELNIAVVGLAQISRGAEKNDGTGGRPMLSDLKDSGMIEQEADLVICPFRENTSGMDVNAETEMEILLLKNRHGPLGEIDAIWIPRNMKIVENNSKGSYGNQQEAPINGNNATEITEDDEDEIPY
jgi:replicative DNA helicase